MLGALLHLGVSRAHLICDIKNGSTPDLRAEILKQATGNCIVNSCSTERNASTVTERCGPIDLTTIQFSSEILSSDISDCVGQIQKIIDQCLITNGVLGGFSETDRAAYYVSIDVGPAHPILEARRGGIVKERKRPAAVTKTKVRTRKGKHLSKTNVKKGKTAAKTRAKKVKACPAPDQKKGGRRSKEETGNRKGIDTGKNIVRDIEHPVLLPRVGGKFRYWLAGRPYSKTSHPSTGGGAGELTLTTPAA